MKKSLHTLLSCVLIFCTIALFLPLPKVALAAPAAWDGSIGTSYEGGAGTIKDPYQISNGAQLAYMASRVNSGRDVNLYYLLLNDLDLGGQEWTSTKPRFPMR